MLLKNVLCFCMIAGLLLVACQKKKKTDELSNKMAAMETEKPTEDTAEIFNEYYEKKDEPSLKRGSSRRISSSSSATDFAPDGPYVVQISCVASRRLADKLSSDCESRGWPAYVVEVVNPAPDLTGTYYRVRIGGFNGLSSARKFGEELCIPEGYQYWIDNRSNDNVGMSGYGLGEKDINTYETPGSSTQQSPAPASEWVTQPSVPESSIPAQEPVYSTPAEPSVSTPSTPTPSETSSIPDTSSRPAPTDGWGKSDDWGSDSGW